MTDGTEHPDGANAPGQGPWNTPSAPQPPAAPSGYGYPPQEQIPYGQQPAYQQPGYQQPGYEQPGYEQPGYEQPGYEQSGYQQPSFSNDLDWDALADANEARRRRSRRLRTGLIILVVCVLGVGAGVLVIQHEKGTSGPSASSSPSASASASASEDANSPTVPGEENVLADKSGQNNLAMGSDAAVSDVGNGYVVRFRSNGNSYAQSSTQLIDVSKSFSVSAWVYNEAPNGSRSAISQGDGVSSSFSLGREASNADRKWIFKVQTAGGGADSTTYQAEAGKDVNTVNEWVLLTGTYDAKTKKISLYVNGELADSTAVPGVWAGKGPLQLGRARTHGVWGDYWSGVVGHILVWDEALTPDQVANVKQNGAGGEAKPIASWLVG